MDTPRLRPLPADEWSDEARQVVAGGMTNSEGEPLNIFATFAHHPKLLKRWMVFANHVLGKSTFSERDRELLILRTGWLCQSPYEWGQHVIIGRRCDLTDEEIARVREGPEAEGWNPFDAALLRAADELHRDAKVSDATWSTLAGRYDAQQLLDAVFTVGQYHVVAFALNSCGVALDPGVHGLDEPPSPSPSRSAGENPPER